MLSQYYYTCIEGMCQGHPKLLNLCNYTFLKYTNHSKNSDDNDKSLPDSISIFEKSDGIDYCDFHYDHSIMIIPIYFPTPFIAQCICGRAAYMYVMEGLHTCMC